MKIEKLIKEYQSKKYLQEKELSKIEDMIRKLRSKQRSMDKADYRTERMYLGFDMAVANSRKQSYTQFIVDLESLND